MNSSPLKVTARYVGGWGLLIFFVGLLTSIFSFLGAIICAVLAGMMLGATKQARWQAIPISFVFPGVIFTLVRLSRAELAGRQIWVLSVLCFGAYWLTYLATWGVMVMERQQASGVARPAGTQPARRPPRSGWPTQTLILDLLQGKWLSATNDPNGQSREKIMEIERQKLTLSVSDAQGRVSLRAKAEVKLENLGRRQQVIVSSGGGESAADFLVSI